RSLLQVEDILKATPEVESYSRRTGARLALAISEPNTGDFLVKLKHDRKRSVEQVTDELREKIHTSQPVLHVEFAGILNDLIGDLTWSPAPIEVKVFSPDQSVLRAKAKEIAGLMEHIDGVVDVFDGVVVTGPALTLRGEPVVLPPGAAIEYGGFYKQQQEAFRNLLFVLLMAVVLVFTVLLAEFGRFAQPLAIVWGALLSLFGVFAALAVTHTTFNIISFLGAIIGVGIVAKNGILLLDSVEHFERAGHSLAVAL